MKPFVPQIAQIEDRTMLRADTIGQPDTVAQPVIERLFGTAYGTKFKVMKPKGKEFKIGALCARWLTDPEKSMREWHAAWGLEVPKGTKVADLLQKDPAQPVTVEVWKGGTVAQILHAGPYSEEGPTVQKLHEFITTEGYQVIGPHEEEYRSRPSAKVPKTIIRCLVRRIVK